MNFICLERSHGCLGAWEGGPVGPGPPPLGPWGASQGLPGGGSRPQTTRTTSPPRPFEFASKVISICILIFHRFGVDLGSLSGVIFGHVGVFFGPSWSRNRLRIDLSSKKLVFLKCFFAQIDPKMGPRSTQDRSKMGPRSSWVAFFVVLNFRFDF